MEMESDSSIHDVMARLQARDDTAAQQIFQRYAERLVQLAARKLEPLMRSKMDPEDVVQSALQSFFTRRAAGDFKGVDTWDRLWKILVTLTLRKCGRRVTYFFADCRDVHREVSRTAPAADESGDNGWDALFADPTAEEAAKLAETLEVLMTRLGKDDPRWGEQNRQILALRLQGFEEAEISKQLGCARRTVIRVMSRARDILTRMQAEED